MTKFNTSTKTAGLPIIAEPTVLKNPVMQSKWSKLHADKYCKGDLILHIDSKEVCKRPILCKRPKLISKTTKIGPKPRNSTLSHSSAAFTGSVTLLLRIRHSKRCDGKDYSLPEDCQVSIAAARPPQFPRAAPFTPRPLASPLHPHPAYLRHTVPLPLQTSNLTCARLATSLRC